MKRKKFIAIMMASAMLCSMVTGCSKEKKEHEDQTEKETAVEETEEETNETQESNHEDSIPDDEPTTDVNNSDVPESYYIDGKYVICPVSSTGTYEVSGNGENHNEYPNGSIPDYYYEEYADTEYLELAIEYSELGDFYDFEQTLQYDGYTYLGIEINNSYYYLTEGFLVMSNPEENQICDIVYVTKIPEVGLQHVMDIESMTETDYGYECTQIVFDSMNQITYEWHRDSQLLINHYTLDISQAAG